MVTVDQKPMKPAPWRQFAAASISQIQARITPILSPRHARNQ